MRNVPRENTFGGIETMQTAQVVVYPSGMRDDNPVGDQSVKKMAIRTRKAPSKVNMAIGTHRNTPHVTGKPGEFRRVMADIL